MTIATVKSNPAYALLCAYYTAYYDYSKGEYILPDTENLSAENWRDFLAVIQADDAYNEILDCHSFIYYSRTAEFFDAYSKLDDITYEIAKNCINEVIESNPDNIKEEIADYFTWGKYDSRDSRDFTERFKYEAAQYLITMLIDNIKEELKWEVVLINSPRIKIREKN